ncbi:peptide chain release factor N(5)-glutamine methyltransferase [Novosphingobium sp. APW14]|jgi:release factor glutamine methyltransferase|uniref:peptide chain release factor N(5)-glutamine methyltransferase n=1 Tax=Novosphingobium sp. APW14 TaxID=3077237 RepID=UPI0028DD613F|nr:peptide chain release factor N(5)-glutamine methyltransferase [Novosphingobium sp. APW14]MDT9012397.1 peptide chain release factor N(5)-glutamine methyltransferase [Novosphingobium sp. APW14]
MTESNPAQPEPVEGAARTVADAIRAATELLGSRTDSARLDAELLMAEALQVRRSDLFLRHMRDPEPPAFAELVARRAAHEPVAYIRGYQEFYGLPFMVSPAVLIPRGDSETLVEAALAARPDAGRVLDCGTGSGALLLAVLHELPQARGIGIDRSEPALAVAAANATRLGLGERATMIRADWHEPGWGNNLGGPFDLILANPPYVESDAPLDPTVRDHEPAGALFSGADGLDDYRVLVPQLPGLLADQGVALVEIGYTQAEAVSAIGAAAGLSATLYLDLAERPRVLEFKKALGKSGPSA